MNDEEYEEVVKEVSEMLIGFVSLNRHPTLFLCKVIEQTYGHKVALNDLVELIEHGELV